MRSRQGLLSQTWLTLSRAERSPTCSKRSRLPASPSLPPTTLQPFCPLRLSFSTSTAKRSSAAPSSRPGRRFSTSARFTENGSRRTPRTSSRLPSSSAYFSYIPTLAAPMPVRQIRSQVDRGPTKHAGVANSMPRPQHGRILPRDRDAGQSHATYSRVVLTTPYAARGTVTRADPPRLPRSRLARGGEGDVPEHDFGRFARHPPRA